MSSTEQGLNLEAISQEIDQEKGGFEELKKQRAANVDKKFSSIPDLRKKQEELFLKKNEADELLAGYGANVEVDKMNKLDQAHYLQVKEKIENFDKLIKSIY